MKELEIVYQDQEIIIINKSQGLSSQGGAGVTSSVDTILSAQLGYPIFLVHRLDRDTAGLMIVAKTKIAATKWTSLIATKTIEKTYEALCVSSEPAECNLLRGERKGVISTPIIQHGAKKAACTRYKIICTKNISHDICLIHLRLTLLTGRMHQIRIHLAQNSLPIAGDDKHGNFKLNKILKKTLGIKTMQLCCVSLKIPNKIVALNKAQIPIYNFLDKEVNADAAKSIIN